MISSTRQVWNVASFNDCASGFRCSVPCAAAGSEWIKADQRNVLFERSEFAFRRLSSFRCREPCAAGQGFGCHFSAYSFWPSKKSKTAGGPEPAGLSFYLKVPKNLK
jgi:hypothetical protein